MPASGLASGNEMHGYIAGDDTGTLVIKDTKSIGSAYDRYLQSAVTFWPVILHNMYSLMILLLVCWKHSSLVLKQLSSYNPGEASTVGGVGLARPVVSGMPGHSVTDPAVMRRPGSGGHDFAPNGRNVNFAGQLPVDTVSMPGPETVPLPPDASSTLYVEGLPSDCTRREVARILFSLRHCCEIVSFCFHQFVLN